MKVSGEHRADSKILRKQEHKGIEYFIFSPFTMTKKKFISDYTERFGFYMLEGYSDTVAVEKMLGEVYKSIKRPKIKQYEEYVFMEAGDIIMINDWSRSGNEHKAMLAIADSIYKKYLSDSNGGDSTDIVSE